MPSVFYTLQHAPVDAIRDTHITAIFNEVAVITFLQFDVNYTQQNFCGTAVCTTYVVVCLYCAAARRVILLYYYTQKVYFNKHALLPY